MSHLQREKAVRSDWWGQCKTESADGTHAWIDVIRPNKQIDIWLSTGTILNHSTIAALLPEDWPTLPANLLTDPGHVLDHLLARHDAESDGRSPEALTQRRPDWPMLSLPRK